MKNGLYSIVIDLLNSREERLSGVMIFRDGRILGGGPFHYFTGSYTANGDAFRGEVVANQHTPMANANPWYRAREVSMGFTGTADDQGGAADGTALVGKASLMFKARLQWLAETV